MGPEAQKDVARLGECTNLLKVLLLNPHEIFYREVALQLSLRSFVISNDRDFKQIKPP